MPSFMALSVEKEVAVRLIQPFRAWPPMAQTAGPAKDPRRRRLERWAAGASLGSAAVHGALVREHAQEWWGYGLFFALAALAQVLLGIALLTDAVNPKDTGPRWASVRRAVYWVGLSGTVLLLALYVVTRTVGIPWFGPEAGTVEGVAAVDIAAKALELVAAVALALLLRMPKEDAPAPSPAAPAS